MGEIQLLPEHVAALCNWFTQGTPHQLYLYSRFESVTDYERLAVRREEGEIVFAIEKSTNVDWEY